MKIPNKFLQTLKLMRVDKPTGYLLVFFPALFGLLLANPSNMQLAYLLPLFIAGSITARSAGCIINDLLDRNFDKHVARTKNRPLTSGELTISYAVIITIILAIISLFILLLLNRTAIYIGFFACVMIILYPLMKRITYFPQVFLGLTFKLGLLIGYAAVAGELHIQAFIMYIACCCWGTAYDTIYGFMDLNDDKKVGIKSLAILLEKRHYKIWLAALYIIFIILFLVSTITVRHTISYILVFAASILLLVQIATLNIYDTKNCLIRFKANNYVGLLLGLALYV